MALEFTNISTTLNTVTFTVKNLHGVEHGFWGYSLDGGNYVVFQPSSASQASHTITGLSEGTTYSLQVRAIVTGISTLIYTSTVNFTTQKSQTGPTVTASVTGIGPTSFTVNGSANVTCRNWQYQINGGAWQTLSTSSSATSVSKQITGLAEDTTYTVRVRATRTYNGVTGTSVAVSVTTSKNQVPPTIALTITNITATSFKINASANFECKDWTYVIVGSGWQVLSEGTGTTASKTITGLTPGTAYSVQVHGRRTYNDVSGLSSVVPVSTLGGAVLNSASTITMDAPTVGVKFNWTVSGAAGLVYDLRIVYGATTFVTVEGITGSSGSKTVNLTADQRYTLLGRDTTAKSITVAVVIDSKYGGTLISSSSKVVTATTTATNSAPIFTGWEHEENNAKVASVVDDAGYHVDMLSTLKITADEATPQNRATLKTGAAYGIIIGRTTTTSADRIFTRKLNAYSDNLAVDVFAEDSRGYRTTIRKYITVKNYSKPQVLEWQARRKDSIGEETALLVLGSIQNYEENSLLKAQVRTQEVGSVWGAWQTLAGLTDKGVISSGRRGYEYSKADWNILDPEKSFNVQLRYQDAFEEYSSVVQFTIARGIPLVSFRDDKVGINNYNPQAGLDVNNGLIVDGVSVGSKLTTLETNHNTLSGQVTTLDSQVAPIGKMLRFRVNITLSKSSFSSSTGYHFQKINANIPSGNSGYTSAPWLQVQIMSSGIWLTSPITVTSSQVSFYVARVLEWDYGASPQSLPAIVLVRVT